MDFGQALKEIKAGKRVSRERWNRESMFIFLVPGSTFVVNRMPMLAVYPVGTGISYRAHVDLRTAQGDIVPWQCSQSDLLADDWGILPDDLDTML